MVVGIRIAESMELAAGIILRQLCTLTSTTHTHTHICHLGVDILFINISVAV